MSADERVVSDVCSDCASSDLAYYIYVPDDGADQILGLVVIGGEISLEQSSTAQIQPYFVMANNQIVPVTPPSLCTYVGSGLPTGTTVASSGVVTSGATAGDGEVVVSYDNSGTTISCPVNVSVTA